MLTAEDKLRWIFDILSIPNQLLSLAEKATLIMTRFEIDAVRHEPDRGNCTTVWIPNIAERNGLSKQTVGSSLKSLSEKGIIEREVYSLEFEKRRVAISLPEQLLKQPRRMLASIDLPVRNHGGKRIAAVECKDCGAIGFQFRAGYEHICHECGSVHFYPLGSVNLLVEDQLEG